MKFEEVNIRGIIQHIWEETRIDNLEENVINGDDFFSYEGQLELDRLAERRAENSKERFFGKIGASKAFESVYNTVKTLSTELPCQAGAILARIVRIDGIRNLEVTETSVKRLADVALKVAAAIEHSISREIEIGEATEDKYFDEPVLDEESILKLFAEKI